MCFEIIGQSKNFCEQENFAVQTNHRVKIKENEKIDNYLNIAKELKNLWN